MIEVDPNDPAFDDPTKFVGPIYDKPQADKLAREMGWTFKQDGQHWRRVVASPEPKRIFEIRPIRWLVDKNVVVICAGGGGIPTMYQSGGDRALTGVEAVIDKDFASELLARELAADVFVMATDVNAVYADWGTPDQRPITRATLEELHDSSFAAGSMGPKVQAAVRFVEHTGNRAAIGSLTDIEAIVDGKAGTQVVTGKD
jgi:carbamate kinase